MRSRFEAGLAWVPLLVYVASVGGFLLHSPYAWTDFPLDDAWIHRVYARSLAFGRGMAYNDGVQEAGATSPLWILLTAPPHWLSALGVPAVVFGVKLVGVLLGAGAVAGLRRIALLAGAGAAGSVLAACVLAVEPRLAFSALAGMEPVLVATLWIAVAWTVLAGRHEVALVLLGLAPLARPEAALIIPFGVAALALDLRSRAGAWPRRGFWLALVAPAATWSVFCRLVNGHWLPNTFQVKAKTFHLGGAEVGQALGALTQHGWGRSAACWIGAAALAGAVFIGARGRHRLVPLLLLLLVAPSCFALAVVGSRSFRLDGYYWTRWTDPAALVLTAACALGFGLMLGTGGAGPQDSPAGGATGRPWPWLGRATGLVGAAALLLAALGLPGSYVDRRSRLATDSRAIHAINVEAGRFIHDHTPAGAVVGVNDAGAIRFFGQRETVDLLGLNSAEIAFRRVHPGELLARLDYLAVFPDWFRGGNLLGSFEEVASFGVPFEEYTLCPCPGQTRAIVARRKEPR